MTLFLIKIEYRKKLTSVILKKHTYNKVGLSTFNLETLIQENKNKT